MKPMLNKADFVDQTRKILLVDIAVPRDIALEVGAAEKVLLKNVDDLNGIVDENYSRRMADVPLAQRIIANEMGDFLIWYYSQPLLPGDLPRGVKPDAIRRSEILRVKQFLLENVSELHKMAIQSGAASFSGHVEVVKKLAAMKNEIFTARFAGKK